MHLKKNSKLITMTVVAFSMVSISATIYSYHLFEQRRSFTDRMIRGVKATNELISGSDKLTAAIRAFAATGEERYWRDYQNELTVIRTRDRAISELRAIGLPRTEMELLETAKQNSDALVALQNQAHDAVGMGNFNGAIAIVFGEEYQRARASIVDPIRRARDSIEERTAKARHLYTERADAAKSIAVTASVLNAVTILVALLIFFQRRVITPLAELTVQTGKLLAGDRNIRFDHADDRSEIGELARALENYRKTGDEVEQQRWLRSGLVTIATAVQQADTPAEFARSTLSLLAPMLQSGAAVMYLLDADSGRLNCIGGYGIKEELCSSLTFGPGEGVPGETALSGKVAVVRNVPADYLRIVSGLGERLPEVLLVAPVKSGAKMLAVMELALLSPPDDRQWLLLQEVADTIAPRLEILLRTIRTEQLLQESQEQARQLEYQARKMEEQARLVEEQSVELQITNQSLLEQRNELEEGRQKLSEQQATLLNILDHSPVGTAFTTKGIFRYTNPEFTRMFDAREGDAAEKIYVNPEDRAQMIETLKREGIVRSREMRMIGSGGEPRDFLVTFMPLTHDGEEGVMGWLLDITERKQALVATQHARDMAEEATRIKSDFLSNMSHEIRTPMNAIIGMSQLALKTELTARQYNYLNKIQQSGLHLLGIINDILDFSKIEAGKLNMEQIGFELEKVLDNVAGLTIEKAAEKGLELIFDIDMKVPNFLVGDPLRLGQILVNYVSNAVKFTDAGEIIISVRLCEETEKDVLLLFSVKDTGIGLTEEQRSHLFESFQQADTSTTRKFGGTGLGLSICKRLIGLMNGELGVESEFDKGSTFWFKIRLPKGTVTAPQFKPAPDLSGRRVLVVDDNESARCVMTAMLSSMSFVVTAVHSGKSALEEIQSADNSGTPYEIVFLDWRMPDMSGIETSQAIRRLQLTAMPNMILVTAFGRDEVLQEAEEAGLHDVLLKPVHASILFNVAMQVLSGTREEMREKELETVQGPEELARIKGAAILLVEDNEINQELAVELLTSAGLDVELAANGQAAVEKVGRRDYDAVLMDIQMPVMDGLEATRIIRALPGKASLPIIAMTANAMVEDRQACLDAGMNDHVIKPIDPDHLFSTLVRWIRPAYQESVPTALGPDALPDEAELPAIPGIDIPLGLRRVLGKRERYRNILRKFTDNQQVAPEVLSSHLATGNLDAARQFAHTIKGVAGNIGASGLQELAEGLETAICGDMPHDTVAAKASAVSAALTTLIADINRLLPHETDAAQQATVETFKAAALCGRLTNLLATDNIEAVQLFEENAILLRNMLPPQSYEAMEQAIRQYDFEKALEIMKQTKGIA